MTKQYGADGFIPTVETVTREDGVLVLKTIDPREKTDLVQTTDGLARRAEFMTTEQEVIEELR
jgi:hypothetical protein